MTNMLVVFLISLSLANALPYAGQARSSSRAEPKGIFNDNFNNKDVITVDKEYQVKFSLPGLEVKDFDVIFDGDLAEIRIKQDGSPLVVEAFKVPENSIKPYWTYDNEYLIIHLPVVVQEPQEVDVPK